MTKYGLYALDSKLELTYHADTDTAVLKYHPYQTVVIIDVARLDLNASKVYEDAAGTKRIRVEYLFKLALGILNCAIKMANGHK